MLVFMRKRRIIFVYFISGCVVKFKTFLIIRNTILLIVCSSLLSCPKKNCRAATQRNRRPPSRLVRLLWPHPELLHLLDLVPRRHLQLPTLLRCRRHLIQQCPMLWTRARLLKDQRRRQKGGEWESIKIFRGNMTYIPNQTKRVSLLTRSRPHSYQKTIGPQDRVRNHSRNMNRCWREPV
jgi:hypothetical protein